MKSGVLHSLLTKILSLLLYFHLTDYIKTAFMAVSEENSARALWKLCRFANSLNMHAHFADPGRKITDVWQGSFEITGPNN
jgi:hypothetical protein